MTIITTSRYRKAPRPCRSSTGHGAACSDRKFGLLRKRLLSTNPAPRGRNDPLSNRSAADQYAQSTGRKSHTATAAPKSP
jgi:hypothetical protein